MCRDHGRYYDPRREAGCTVCRGEEPGVAAPEVGRPWGRLALGMVAIVVVSTFFLGAERTAPAAGPDPEPTLKMTANPFREEIEKLEYILYAESSYGAEDARQILFLAGKLADEMREWESRLHMLSHVGLVRDFADQVERGAEQDFGDADLFATRDAWQRLRDKIFEPADWFLR